MFTISGCNGLIRISPIVGAILKTYCDLAAHIAGYTGDRNIVGFGRYNRVIDMQ